MTQHGAVEVEMLDILDRMIKRGYEMPMLRPTYSLVLNMFQSIARGEKPNPLLLDIKKNGSLKVSDLPGKMRDSIRDITILMEAASDLPLIDPYTVQTNVTFPHSETLGGADAQLIMDRELYDTRTSWKREPLQKKDVLKQMAYVLLDEKRNNLKSIVWFFTRHQMLISLPVERMFSFFNQSKWAIRTDFLEKMDKLRERQKEVRLLRLMAYHNMGLNNLNFPVDDWWDEEF